MSSPQKTPELLAPTSYLDFEQPAVRDFARDTIGDGGTPMQHAIRLFYAVRDEVAYDPLRVVFSPEGLRASAALTAKSGYCVSKAVLLAAVARAVGIPARLGFADVRNHMTSPRLHALMKTNLFVWHGYAELYLEERWFKLTPAFDRALCERMRVLPLEFDGTADAVSQPYSIDGERCLEAVRLHGSFTDVPFDSILAGFHAAYPHLMQLMQATATRTLGGSFRAEANAGGKHDE